jgi:hypothetical protein
MYVPYDGKKVGRLFVRYWPSCGKKNPQPPKNPQKKERKNKYQPPPLILSKDGMIESLFPLL